MKLKTFILTVGIFMLSLSAFASKPEMSDPAKPYYLTYYINNKSPFSSEIFKLRVEVNGTFMYEQWINIGATPQKIDIGFNKNAIVKAYILDTTRGIKVSTLGAYPVNQSSSSGIGTSSPSVTFSGLTQEISTLYIEFYKAIY